MSIRKPYLITPDGLAKLEEEVVYLKTTKREEIAARITRALEDGQDDDFVDNAELEASRNEQSFLEGRIIEIEDILRNYELIEDQKKKDIVRVGSYVTVVEDGFDEEERYHLVGAAEADPLEGRISNESPLGSALLGAKKGATVQFNAPRGEIEFKIVTIE